MRLRGERLFRRQPVVVYVCVSVVLIGLLCYTTLFSFGKVLNVMQ